MINSVWLSTLAIMHTKLSEAFRFAYFIHAGILDAITTMIALHIGFSELNPAVASLFPDYVYAIPAFLVLLAYLRGLSVVILYKKSRFFIPMLWFSLYFPGLFNAAGLAMFFLNPIAGVCCLL